MPVRIGAIQDKNLAVVFRTGIHQPYHGYVISVEAQPYILYVYNQYVELSYGTLTGFLGFSIVERKNGDSCF